MQKIFISHFTALTIIRQLRIEHSYLNIEVADKSEIKLSNITKETFNLTLWDGLDCLSKKDVLVNGSSKYHKSNFYNIHSFCGKFPKDSFLEIDNDIYVSSPELLFCQLASCVSFARLMLYGLEICGTFSLKNASNTYVLYGLKPITSVSKIRKFVDSFRKLNPGYRGLEKACDVIKYLVNNSASPQESRLYTALCCPRKIGAFSLSGMQLNQDIKLTKEACKICGSNIVRPDICNIKNKVAIEYESDAFHNNFEQLNHDKRRVDALYHDKWKVFLVVPTQLHDYTAFYEMACDMLVANKQDKRIRTKNFKQKYFSLMDELYAY